MIFTFEFRSTASKTNRLSVNARKARVDAINSHNKNIAFNLLDHHTLGQDSI